MKILNSPQAKPSNATTPQLSHYETMYKIRAVENLLLDYFSKGLLRGTTHTYLGQEAIAVAALSYLHDEDMVVSNHRSHGHFIAYGHDYKELLEEIKGSPQGVCRGLGGSQHLHYKNFYSNGVLGGTVPVATGMALAEKLKLNHAMAVCFLGDGAFGEGIVYEAFNMASLWQIPILFVVENNRYAQSTPVEHNLAGSIAGRLKAFNIETNEIESNDIGELLPRFDTAFRYVRNNRKPFCQIVHTYRLGPHSKGDDVRSREEMDVWRLKDPLILAKKYFDPAALKEIEDRQSQEIQACFESTFDNAAIVNDKARLDNDDEMITPILNDHEESFISESADTLMVSHLNQVLKQLMQTNEKMYLLGEDLLDPYGGAFKVTKGLQAQFPKRIFSSPVSEAGLVGIANGMALRGLVPIVEIMFGDFSTLIVDQMTNYATKFKRMYGRAFPFPLIVRTPMGGYRGYGPTHSQSLEKIFLGIPGLTVIACDSVHDQKLIWDRMIKLASPCFYVENKALYGQKIKPLINGKIESFYTHSTASYFPTISLQITPLERDADVVLLAYGGMTPLAMEVAKEIYIEEEIVVKVVIPSQIAPLPKTDLREALIGCRKLVVLEEGTERNGWGAEVGAFIAEDSKEKIHFGRCAAQNTIIPNSKTGEEAVLPNRQSCYAAIKDVLDVV